MKSRLVTIRELAIKLFEINAIKFGEFKLKSGKKSPIYIDLRIIPSYPDVLDFVTDAYIRVIESLNLKFDKIAGVPTSAIPLASIVSFKLKKPMIYIRKEKKDYGTGKVVEGVLYKGEKILILDDVATTGSSIMEAVNKIRVEGGLVNEAVVLIDREQGANSNLNKEGIKLYSFTKIRDVLMALKSENLIDKETYRRVIEYISGGV